MYSTCIFCNAPLGANELLERFPVGRRVAYDQRTGRLWAVCRTCERWNLSPFETRWEAIEDAEKLFRATPLKVAGENIGLAQTTEGLEIVRIGSPPKTEMAAWRYGDQFGYRDRRRKVLFGAVGTGMLGPGAMGIASIAGVTPPIPLTIAVTLLNFAAASSVLMLLRRGKPRLFVRDADGALLRLTSQDTRLAVLVPDADGGWHLELSHDVPSVVRGRSQRSKTRVPLYGDVALRALARVMPFANWVGGDKRALVRAVDTIADARTTYGLLAVASRDETQLKTHFKTRPGEANISVLSPHLRLALEMALHEDDEQRAMEGELTELEARWKEADALAKIADC